MIQIAIDQKLKYQANSKKGLEGEISSNYRNKFHHEENGFTGNLQLHYHSRDAITILNILTLRYDAITHPMNFSGSWRRAKVLVGVAWFLSAAFASPILHFYNTKETEDYGTQCWIHFEQQWQWQLYMTLVSVTLFVIPAFLIAACYIIIVCTIWSKGKGNISQNEFDEARRASSSRGLIPKAKVKTIKMTFVIISVFILCWSPYIVFDLLQVSKKRPRINRSKQKLLD